MDNGGAFTDRLIEQASIKRGSRVLDFGCGGGDVTFRLAKAVGNEGTVVGIDLNETALEAAAQKAAELDIKNVHFERHDVFDYAQKGETFDVVMCRRVLMYLPHQVKAAQAIHSLLQPNGMFILQEHDSSVFQSNANLPLHEKARSWIWDTVAAEGANVGTGFDLHSILADAGFSHITISAEAIVETPSQAGMTAGIVSALLSRIEDAGVATAAEIDAETLSERLNQERETNKATLIGEMIFGAIARV